MAYLLSFRDPFFAGPFEKALDGTCSTLCGLNFYPSGTGNFTKIRFRLILDTRVPRYPGTLGIASSSWSVHATKPYRSFKPGPKPLPCLPQDFARLQAALEGPLRLPCVGQDAQEKPGTPAEGESGADSSNVFEVGVITYGFLGELAVSIFPTWYPLTAVHMTAV